MHSEPEDARSVTAAKDASPVEIHGEALMILQHLSHCVYYLRNIFVRSVADEFQRKVNTLRLDPVDTFLVSQLTSQTLQKRDETIVVSLYRYCEEKSFHDFKSMSL